MGITAGTLSIKKPLMELTFRVKIARMTVSRVATSMDTNDTWTVLAPTFQADVAPMTDTSYFLQSGAVKIASHLIHFYANTDVRVHDRIQFVSSQRLAGPVGSWYEVLAVLEPTEELAYVRVHAMITDAPPIPILTQLQATETGARITESLTLSVQYSASVLADSPDVYYKFDEVSGTSAVDSSGNGHNGTYANPIFELPPLVHGSQYAVVVDSVVTPDTYNNIQLFSYEIWFKTTTVSGGVLAIVSDGSAYDRMVYLTNAGDIIFGWYNSGNQFIQAAGPFNDGQRHHLVVTFNPATAVNIYADKTLRATLATPVTAFDQNGHVYFGGFNQTLIGWPSGPSSSAPHAVIDEAALYTHELSLARVGDHYDIGVAA